MTEFSQFSTSPSLQRADQAQPTKLPLDNSAARKAAEKLEATFLAEMLKSAGFGAQENSFSGSTGEDQFASFHRLAIAEKMVVAGGIGLAEHILRHMTEVSDET